MEKILRILPFIFWGLLVTDCVLISQGLHDYRIYTKTLLVPVLLIGVYAASQETKHRKSKVIITLAFFFCFLGDFFLLNDAELSNFILGLSGFLLAHLFFIYFFLRLKKFSDKYRLFLFANTFIILVYIGALLFVCHTGIMRNNMEIPVGLYAIVLGLMLLTAIHTVNNKSLQKLAKVYFIPGALFFVLSDSLLALQKFALDIRYGGILVMVTYAAAIFILYLGVIRFLRK
ncbi:lysoplasmalogenase [Panacibacter sp. DH6]|uniref:Lysoplasmalogenase n=1 Tax=Panacibacter microcysteis TaxID=2793269 RepID=A0A931MEC2_9BACT|nr:lysoplasmalogenase [Panacibacter microcysteis]MBG9378189.1 lysoplasmalogenase [Panacibacter microcysteis]